MDVATARDDVRLARFGELPVDRFVERPDVGAEEPLVVVVRPRALDGVAEQDDEPRLRHRRGHALDRVRVEHRRRRAVDEPLLRRRARVETGVPVHPLGPLARLVEEVHLLTRYDEDVRMTREVVGERGRAALHLPRDERVGEPAGHNASRRTSTWSGPMRSSQSHNRARSRQRSGVAESAETSIVARIASASALGSRGATTEPTPGPTISGGPPLAQHTTGVPDASDSTRTSPNASS